MPMRIASSQRKISNDVARPSGENHRREKESTCGRLLPPKQPTEHVELERSDVVMASGGDGSEQARTH
jgi:hypothetical protein